LNIDKEESINQHGDKIKLRSHSPNLKRSQIVVTNNVAVGLQVFATGTEAMELYTLFHIFSLLLTLGEERKYIDGVSERR
jgi:hypothetical protein